MLGSGGTDGAGSFVQGASFGIVLSRPLLEGEKIFAVDTHNGSTGPAVSVRPAPVIPDVTPWGAATLAFSLLVVMLARVRAARLPDLRRPRK